MKFKVGDYVTIRQYEDMKSEFGANAAGQIKCGMDWFVVSMKKFCGKRMRIAGTFNGKYALVYGESWRFTEEMFEENKNPTRAKQEIHITVDGLKTIAVLKSGGKVVRRTAAKCNPADTFDFETGAKLAIERLFGREKKNEEKAESRLKFKVGDELVYTGTRWFEKGAKVRVQFFDGAPIMPYYVTDDGKHGYWVDADELQPLSKDEEKPTFVPHLEILGKYEGNIGEPTKFKDVVGRPLYIGDTVIHFDEDGKEYPETVICKDEYGAYVFGIKMACDGETGKIKEGWKIIKKRGYDEVADGEIIYDGVKYVKTDNK